MSHESILDRAQALAEARRKPTHNRVVKARQSLTQEAVIEAITNERGMILHAANALGVSRKILREYIADHAACADAHKEAREAMGDTAERKLYDMIDAGDVRCIMYYLSTVHRDRGYGMKGHESLPNNNQTYVSTVNIVAIPSGQFLDHNAPGVVLEAKVSDRKIPAPYAEIEKMSSDKVSCLT